MWACRRISADQRAHSSSSTSAAAHHTTLYILTTFSSPCQIVVCKSWMCFDPVFVPVRVLVGLCTLDSSRHFWCTLDSSRHFSTPLHSTHLTIEVPPPLSCFCELHLSSSLEVNKENIYSHTVSALRS